MKCWKCDKAIHRDDGSDSIMEGINVRVILTEEQKTPANIEYNNLQLGRYSDGNGECHVAICYECYIDGLFHVRYET